MKIIRFVVICLLICSSTGCTKKNIAKYDRKIESLDDDFEKERVARNMFQMVKDNEVIYKYVEKDNNANNIKEEKWKEN